MKKRMMLGAILAAVVLAGVAIQVLPNVIIDCEYLWPLCYFV